MDIALFDYSLPPELIAQEPAPRRDGSRLLLVNRTRRTWSHHRFAEFPDLLPARARLFRNNAAVLRARVMAQRPTGGKVEVLFLRPAPAPFAAPPTPATEVWRVLVRPAKHLPVGATIVIPGAAELTALARHERGETTVAVHRTGPDATVTALCDRLGEVPLPPYIARSPDQADPRAQADANRYNTVYADPAKKVAAAAPTAGFHFTPEVLAELARRGVPSFDLTLHVGLGTFQPVQVTDLTQHPLHTEFYEIPGATRAALADVTHGPRVAIGTTTVRAAEDAARRGALDGSATPFAAEAALYLYPPATFLVCDALLTNFHLPRSTLLCLVASFLAPGATDGIPFLHELYAAAIAERFRFFSYGDCMLIV